MTIQNTPVRAVKRTPLARLGALASVAGVGAAALLGSAPAQAAPLSAWEKIAQCESTNRWDIDTGNGFYGGLQFTQTSWEAVGGTGSPADASKAEQIARAEKLQDLQGWGAWPVCSKKAGLSGPDTAPDAVVPGAASTATKVSRQALPTATADFERTAAKGEVVKQAERAGTPVEVLEAAKEADAAHEDELAAAERTVFVAPGDSLYKIARQNQVAGGWKALYEANRDIVEDPHLIYVGQELVLPTR